MEDEVKTITEMIKTALMFIMAIALIITAVNSAEKKEYKLICETKQEIIITDGEDIITIEKEEEKGENENAKK